MRIELINNDDTTDNDSGASFSGFVDYWGPSKHRIDAMQLARQVEHAKEATEIDADSFLLATDTKYKGMRFNWDADSQVKHATDESFSGLAGSEWDLAELFTIYGNSVLSSLKPTNALWNTRAGDTERFGFDVDYHNYISHAGTPPVNEFEGYFPQGNAFEIYFAKPIEVLAGLMRIAITHSSTDAPDVVDDDYEVRVTLGIEGWEAF